MAEMLFRTNIIGFVGTGQNTSYASNKLILWDDIQHRPFGELNFKTDVLNVKLRKDRVIVVLLQKIYVYNFQHLDCSDSFATAENPNGLVTVSIAEDNCVFAFPHPQLGCAQIVKLSSNGVDKEEFEIKCHNTKLAAMKLSQNGDILATASNKGTLVRIFSVQSQQQLSELRRGVDQAIITDISIDARNQYLSTTSDKGTVHVFKISENQENNANKKSSLSGLSKLVGYFGSEWSASQFRIKDNNAKCAIVDNKIIAISTQGNYYLGDILKTGEIPIERQESLLEEKNE